MLVSFAPRHAQLAPSNALRFEAASVKERAGPGDGSFVGRRPGGRFAAENASLREIIEYAYNLQPFQLVGSLTPLDSAPWDIAATLGANVPAGPDAIAAAVRALLADRFALTSHSETLPPFPQRPPRPGR